MPHWGPMCGRSGIVGRLRSHTVELRSSSGPLLRLIELALDRVHRLADDLRTTQQLAAQSTAVDDLYRRLAGADVTVSTAHTTVHELEATAENLRAQLAYRSIGQG